METKTLEDITIENMLANIFTNYNIKKRRKDVVDFYKSHLIKTDLFGTSSDPTIDEKQIGNIIDQVLNEDKKSDDPYLTYKNGKYFKSKNKGKNIVVPNAISTNYLGSAGECSVMAELLFNGYNVNNLKVDEGIDLVACKDNVFYYIQVKTTFVAQKNTFHFTIKEGNFMKYFDTQMRYLLVARAKTGKEVRNIYFQFNNKDIDRLRSEGIIGPSAANNININIEYDTRTDKAFAYNGNKRDDVSYYMNNFDL